MDGKNISGRSVRYILGLFFQKILNTISHTSLFIKTKVQIKWNVGKKAMSKS